MKYQVDVTKNVPGYLQAHREIVLHTNDREKALSMARDSYDPETVVFVEVFESGVARPILIIPEPPQ